MAASLPERLPQLAKVAFDIARLRSQLKTNSLGKRVCCFDSVLSTMDTAFRLVEKGAVDGTLVIADEQTAGRGRRGQAWFSPRSGGLWFSIIVLRHPLCALGGVLAPATGLALAAMLNDDLGVPARVKWPNDVRIKGKKVAGILVETRRRPCAMVLGVGLNLRQPREVPGSLQGVVTFLEAECGRCLRREDLLARVLGRLECQMGLCESGERAALVEQWKRYDEFYGSPVELRTGRGSVRGTDVGISDEGCLLLETPQGVRAVSAGEIVGPRTQ